MQKTANKMKQMTERHYKINLPVGLTWLDRRPSPGAGSVPQLVVNALLNSVHSVLCQVSSVLSPLPFSLKWNEHI